MQQYVIVITEINKSDKYQIGKDTRKFSSLEEAKNWIKEESKGHKLNKVFRDRKTGDSFQVGYVWGYWDKYSDSNTKFLHEIWTEILKETIEPVELN